jgi:hypothetical protein
MNANLDRFGFADSQVALLLLHASRRRFGPGVAAALRAVVMGRYCGTNSLLGLHGRLIIIARAIDMGWRPGTNHDQDARSINQLAA